MSEDNGKGASLDYIFHPRSVAIVGARPVKGNNPGGYSFLGGLLKLGFPVIYPVNPNYEQIDGLRCYRTLHDIEGPVDHVISIVPARVVPQLVEDCIAREV